MKASPRRKSISRSISVARLADVARQDADFMQVGELYRDDPAFDVQKLVDELVEAESVPLLPVLATRTRACVNGRSGSRRGSCKSEEDTITPDTRLQKTNNLADRDATKKGLSAASLREIFPSPRNTPALTFKTVPTGGCAASSTCPRNAGSASRTAKAKTAR